MDRRITMDELSARLPALLREVAGGERYTVTDGVEVLAQLSPPDVEKDRGRQAESWEKLQAKLDELPFRIQPWKREDLYD
jgi:antitoxin (DNA-binding transcriptional repressor) of toxin-antitoxin stability system